MMEGRSDLALIRDLRVLGNAFDDPTVNDICINRPGEYFVKRGKKWEYFEAPELTLQKCTDLAGTIGSYNSRPISRKSPILTGELPGSWRVAIIHPPACEEGTIVFAIRRHDVVDKSHEDLIEGGFYSEVEVFSEDLDPIEKTMLALYQEGSKRSLAEFMKLAVTYHKNIVICGPTGGGKTTFMRSLIVSHVSKDERIITLQDAIEMQLLQHPNRVHLLYQRDAKKEDAISVSARQLQRETLRLIPSRVFLAELRGDEAWDFLININSGHPGTMTTLHADSANSAPFTLLQRLMESPEARSLPAAMLQAVIKSTVDVIVFVEDWKAKQIRFDPVGKRRAAKILRTEEGVVEAR